MKTLRKIDKPIMRKKRKHKKGREGDIKTKISNIIPIHRPSPDVSFSVISFGFWLCMVTKGRKLRQSLRRKT